MFAVIAGQTMHDPGLLAWTLATCAISACAGAAACLLVMKRSGGQVTLASLGAALDRAPPALAFFDTDGKLTFWNRGYEDLLRAYGVAARLGLAFRATLATASAPGLPTEIARAALLAGQAGADAALDDFLTPDGRWFQTALSATDDGGFVLVLTDVTDHLALVRREAEARRRTEAAIEVKSIFLANMSHEIRTPLNGVLGMVQIMQRDATDTVQRSRLTIIADAGQALLTALNNVLDLAKVEAGKFGLELQPFDLEDTVRQAIAAHEPLAGHKALDIRLAIDPQALGAWRGDGAKLRQVLAGLLSNAIKFTARGRIELRIAACPDGLAFEVEDSGIGIAEHQLEPIFDSFFQVDSTTTRRFGGTGLGLTICRHLVRLMGGDVTVSSREGVGSVFAFTLPLERSATPVRQPARLEIPAPNDRQRALRVLVAEDNPMNRLVLEGMLEPLDVVVTSVENGRDAVAAFTTQAFDLVLMDIHMPEMDGVEATILMRESETGAHRRRTPILALTANVMPHQLDTYGAAGMDGASPSR